MPGGASPLQRDFGSPFNGDGLRPAAGKRGGAYAPDGRGYGAPHLDGFGERGCAPAIADAWVLKLFLVRMFNKVRSTI